MSVIEHAVAALLTRDDDPLGANSWVGKRLDELTDGIYREAPVADDLTDHAISVWHRRVGEHGERRPIRVVPDGNMDLLWMQGELRIAGPDVTAWLGRLPAGSEVTGLRFRSGVAPSLLGIAAGELVGKRSPVSDFAGGWLRDVAGRLETANSPADIAKMLQDAVRSRLVTAPEPDPIVRHVVQAIGTAPSEAPVRIAGLAEQLGISERQLHRRCQDALGYGPKTLARIVRFRRFLSDARRPSPPSLVQMAFRAGYADQAHLTHEVRRLAGISPSELMAELAASLAY